MGLKGTTQVRDRWKAQIRFDQKIVNLGTFPSAEEAHEAYKLAFVKLYNKDYEDMKALTLEERINIKVANATGE